MSVHFHYSLSTEFQYVNFHVSCDLPVRLISDLLQIQNVPGTLLNFYTSRRDAECPHFFFFSRLLSGLSPDSLQTITSFAFFDPFGTFEYIIPFLIYCLNLQMSTGENLIHLFLVLPRTR